MCTTIVFSYWSVMYYPCFRYLWLILLCVNWYVIRSLLRFKNKCSFLGTFMLKSWRMRTKADPQDLLSACLAMVTWAPRRGNSTWHLSHFKGFSEGLGFLFSLWSWTERVARKRTRNRTWPMTIGKRDTQSFPTTFLLSCKCMPMSFCELGNTLM